MNNEELKKLLDDATGPKLKGNGEVSKQGDHLKSPNPQPNPQAFATSGLAEKCAAEKGELDAFWNTKAPNLAIFHEKPEHRLMLFMKAQGCSNAEIARHSGYTQSWVSQLFRQPWAREILLELMNDLGINRVESLLKGAAEDSVYTLIELRDDEKVNSGVRKGAADSLLDRFLGKPKQQVEVQTSTKVDDVQEIDKQIEALKAEENRLLGHA